MRDWRISSVVLVLALGCGSGEPTSAPSAGTEPVRAGAAVTPTTPAAEAEAKAPHSQPVILQATTPTSTESDSTGESRKPAKPAAAPPAEPAPAAPPAPPAGKRQVPSGSLQPATLQITGIRTA